MRKSRSDYPNSTLHRHSLHVRCSGVLILVCGIAHNYTEYFLPHILLIQFVAKPAVTTQ
jgi:hypothetical protein